jgi:hypothetical protein
MRLLSTVARSVQWISAVAFVVGCDGSKSIASQEEALGLLPDSAEMCGYYDASFGAYTSECVVGRWQGRSYTNQIPENISFIGCPSNAMVTGIWGKSGQFLDHLGVICAWIQFDGTLGPNVRWNDAGGNGGGDFTDITCPWQMAVNGIYGNSGMSVDSIGLECAPFSSPHSQHLQTGTTPSGGGGGAYEVQCGRINSYNDTSDGTDPPGLGGDFITSFGVISPHWIDGLVVGCSTVTP